MEVLKEDFSDIEIGTSAESFQRFLDSQRDLFHSQIDQMQRLVVTQCNLTGVNPLSQEMAAGALSIKIGKRPRDLLNPKAVKYMQSVFSIKDAISKKESREISALFGVTVPQVRDFFVSQRSRVKRQIRLASEKSIRSNTCKESCDGVAPSSDPITSIDPVPLNTIGPPNVEDGPSCSTQDDIPPGIDDLDKQFVQEIFTLMRKEETFSGRVKLMERILRIQNLSVLCWFLMKGGVMILATWLSQAAAEEQTSFLQLILKVLCHLPLHKALPMHMSVILQSVNKLRFYRIQDVSNRARILLSRWSKLLARTQALTKPNGMKPLTETDAILKQSIGEIMHDESWQSNMDNLEGILSLSNRNLGNSRKLESSQMLKLLPSSSDDLNRKNMFGVSSSQIRERRKVQLVEQPGQRGADRSPPATRAATVSQSRPMSTDDIQKAKMRAQYMQSKYGKSSSSIGSMKANIQPSKKPLPTVSKVPDQSNTVEPEKPLILPSNNTSTVEVLPEPKMQVKPKESLQEKCKRIQIQWRSPPEIKLNDLWRVGDGENSKEVEGQKNRIRREKETFYQTLVEIPSNPKGPWDLEMDYDDSLTPEIPTEQLPDTDNCTIETQPEVTIHNQGGNNAVSSLPVSSQNVALGMAEPDLELLAVLLKNPELVFALTSGQADNLSSEDMVKLLDLIKAGGPGLMGGGASSNGLGSSKVEKVEVSLPSPTPSSNPGTRSAWKPQAVRNPFSQQRAMADGFSQHSTRLPPQIPSGILDPHTLISSLHQTSYTNTTIRYSPVINSPLASNTKPLSMASSSNNLQQERASASYFPTQNVQRQPELSSDSWRNATSYPNRAVENSYYSSVVAVGSQQPHLHQGGPSSEGNGKYMGDDVYESWSPGNNSSARASWNFLEHRMNPGRSNRLPDRERQWYGDESRYEDRR